MCGCSDTAHLSQPETTNPLPVTGSNCYGSPMAANQGTRVNLTLPDSLVAVLDRIGAVTGAGRATLIREWLMEAQGGFADVANALELAQKNNLDAFKVLADSMKNTAQQSEQLELEIRSTRRKMLRRKPK